MKILRLISLDILALLLLVRFASHAVADTKDSTAENVLVMTSLDGGLTGVSAQTGRILWNLNAGGFLVGSKRARTESMPDSETVGERKAPLLIPGVDGSILVGSNTGLKQLPYKANEIVGDLPLNTNDELVLGSKVIRAFQISLGTGRLLKTIDGLSDETFGTAESDPDSVWFTRSDYIIRAFNMNDQRQSWNITYGNIAPLDFFPLKPSDSADQPLQSYQPFYSEHNAAFSNTKDGTGRKIHPLSFSTTLGGQLLAYYENGTRIWSTEAIGVPIISLYGVQKHLGKLKLIPIPFVEIWPGYRDSPLPNPPFLKGGHPSLPLPYDPQVGDEVPLPTFAGTDLKDVDPLPSSLDGFGEQFPNPDSPVSTSATPMPELVDPIGCGAIFVGSLPSGELFAHPRWRGSECKESKRARDLESGAGEPVRVFVNSEYSSILHPTGNVPALRSLLTPGNVLEYALNTASWDLEFPLPESHALLPMLPISNIIPQYDVTRLLPADTGSANETTNEDVESSDCTFCDDTNAVKNSGLVVYDAESTAVSLAILPFLEGLVPPNDSELSCLVGFHSVPYLLDPEFLAFPPSDPLGTSSLVPIYPPTPTRTLDSDLLLAVYKNTASLLYHVFPEDLAEAIDTTLHFSLSSVEKSFQAFPILLLLLLVTYSVYHYYRPKLRPVIYSDMKKAVDEAIVQGIPSSESTSSTSSTAHELASAPSTLHSDPYPAEIEKEVDGQIQRVIGPLAVSQEILGWGAQGTVVFSGAFEGRSVAVKRLLKSFHPSAAREISLLVKGDGHRAVVRYYSCIEVKDFLYLALERCEGSLEDALSLSRRRATASSSEKSMGSESGHSVHSDRLITDTTTVGEDPVSKESCNPHRETDEGEVADSNGRNFAALRSKPQGGNSPEVQISKTFPYVSPTAPTEPTMVAPPSPYTREFLLLLIQGLAHLHAQGIIHRDIKPGNILIASTRPQQSKTYVQLFREIRNSRTIGDLPMIYSDPAYREAHNFGTGYWIPKISDFGLGKQMQRDPSNILHFSTMGYHPQFNQSHHPSSLLNTLRQRIGGPVSNEEFEHTLGGRVPLGTTGWQAPEILLPLTRYQESGDADGKQRHEMHSSHSELTNSSITGGNHESNSSGIRKNDNGGTNHRLVYNPMRADVWALGCVMYAIVTGGEHPFGLSHERESNVIMQKGPNLKPIEHIYDLHHLLTQILANDPKQRPSASRILEHPFFWTDETKTTFLVALSDRLEGEGFSSPLMKAFSNPQGAPGVPLPWDSVFHVLFLEGGRKQKAYDPSSMSDCLRFFRNRRNHWHELSPSVFVEGISPSCTSSALVPYFTHPKRLPGFFMYAYDFALRYLAHERQFSVYLGKKTVRLYADRAKEAFESLSKGEFVATDNSETFGTATPATRGWYEQDWPCSIPNPMQIVMNPGGQPIGVLAAHSHLQETRFRGGANIHMKNYKHRLCFDFENSNGTFCPRGIRCDFSHGALECLNAASMHQF